MALDEAPVEAKAAAVAPPLVSAGGPWPSSVPGATEAADALGQGLLGVFAPAGAPLAVVAEVMAGMSPLEKAVLLGEPQPIDVEPIRRAAVMRVRVAVALSTAPQGPGAAPTDPAAGSALLGEIDGLLSDVNALVASAPPEVQPSLEQVRNALVKEAIDFSEAAHRAVPSGAAPEPQPKTGYGVARTAQTRIIAVASKAETESEAEEQKRRRWGFAVLAAAALSAAAYHGYSWWEDRVPVGALGAGALSNAIAVELPNGDRTVNAAGGVPFDPAELKRFMDDERLKGNVVRQIAPGQIVVSKGRGDAPARPAATAAPAAATPAHAGADSPGAAPAPK
jgi:hypothetical protein